MMMFIYDQQIGFDFDVAYIEAMWEVSGGECRNVWFITALLGA